MKQSTMISPALLLLVILAMAVLVAPVSAGLSVSDGTKITETDGSTQAMITITGDNIQDGGTITIDIAGINQYVSNGILTDANVEVSTDATGGATWAGAVTGDIGVDQILTLTSTGETIAGESVFVTFTGAAGGDSAWVADSGGDISLPLTVTRTDTSETSDPPLYFMIQTPAPVAGGLLITDGAKITTPDGATSAVIEIDGQAMDDGSSITIDSSWLYLFTGSGTFTDDNVEISYNSAATWTYDVSDDGYVITLTPAGSAGIGDTITVTITGANGNPWYADTSSSYGDMSLPLTVTRTDSFETASLNFWIETTPPSSGGLVTADGAKITTAEGSTSAVITIDGEAMDDGSSITIDTTWLYLFTDSGTFTDDNVEISYNSAATWTYDVSDDGYVITLTSTGSAGIGDTITVTITGANGNPWYADTSSSYGDMSLPLTVTRTDSFQTAFINFWIETTPPIPPATLGPDFIGTPRSGIAPLEVQFTDLSTGDPISWSWDFGDGSELSTDKDPLHLYEYAGSYKVSITIYNAETNSQVVRTNYIQVNNREIGDADTSIDGLTITNCGGPQTITVDTSVLTDYVLSPDNLEIQLPPENGFKTIIFFGSFSQDDTLITGNPTGVRLVSRNLAPATGFSETVGRISSFTYVIDLPSYPCNAKLSTVVTEGAVTKYDNLLRRIADGNNAGVGGTAFTAVITKTGFPAGATAKIYISVDADWVTTLHGDPGILLIWRIPDDESYGQILPTDCTAPDPVTNLVYCEADSPLGLSTFGVSSISQNNNPFQMVAFVAANVVNQNGNTQGSTANSPGGSSGGTSGSNTGSTISANGEPGSTASGTEQAAPEQEPAPVVSNKPAPLTQPAMSTNVGMVGWLLSTIQNNPIVLVVVVGVIGVVAYIGWWKKRL